jgi:GDPmannose 4,6-dehydratase
VTTALITGITGQDGSYLAELLLAHGYRVIGLVRPERPVNDARIAHIRDRLELVPGDLRFQNALQEIIDRCRPAEIYNLAARASSSQLFSDPVATTEYNGLAVVRLLEAIRAVDPTIRFCQASSSEIFGNAAHAPQDESTPFHPRNPYGIAKLCGHWFTANYREVYGLHACSCILFNHESPRRGTEFVTRKIAIAAARIKAGLQDKLLLGDLDARRDWGFAGDYVQGMWQMLRAPAADDYVLATGVTHTVRDFCDVAFRHVGLDYEDFVMLDSVSRRPVESVLLVGNADKARRVLGWQPTISFEELVRMMVDADLQTTTAQSRH